MEIHNILVHDTGVHCNNDNRLLPFTEMIKIMKFNMRMVHVSKICDSENFAP